ncbi:MULTISPECIES: hypothetical protein [unclassified Microcystis]|nr:MULTISPECIES: hypothetical protein [unclassified Microcystis]MCZ8026605.1 hypothetical protein [Microcystis sp. LE19-10.1B]MCZ8363549.1 hypothetical protein [Microcystis sp. LE19-251.1A]MDJ0606531.1 hypothetical protein [Microcystis sp. M53602_WE12]
MLKKFVGGVRSRSSGVGRQESVVRSRSSGVGRQESGDYFYSHFR